MVDVDDEITDLEIAKIRQKCFRRRPPPLRRATLFFEHVGFRIDLEAGVGQTKAAGERTHGDEHGGVPGVVRALDRDSEHVVFLEELDGAFGAARRRRHKQHGFAGVAEAPDLGNPVHDASLQFDRGLTAHGTVRKGVGMRDSGFSGVRGVIVQSELGEVRRVSQAGFEQVPCREEARRRFGRLAAIQRFFVAVLNLLDQLRSVHGDFVLFRHGDARVFRARQVVECRRPPVVLQDVAQRYDRDLVDRRDRALSGRVVGAERLDRVTDEFEPDRMRLAGRKDVDDAAADCELAVLVGRIFAAEAGINEQFGEIGRRDVLTGLQLERRGEHPLGSRHARQQRRRRRDHHACRAARN